MKVYVAGKISGLPLDVARANFDKYEDILKAQGYEVVNPMKITKFEAGKAWIDYMLECIAELRTCEAIFLQSNWMNSVGARAEHELALGMNLKIYYQNICNEIC